MRGNSQNMDPGSGAGVTISRHPGLDPGSISPKPESLLTTRGKLKIAAKAARESASRP